MFRKCFVCLYSRNNSTIQTIFNKLHALLDITTYMDFKTFEKYLRELERAQTDRQTDRQTECIKTFQLHWKVLKISYTLRNVTFKGT